MLLAIPQAKGDRVTTSITTTSMNSIVKQNIGIARTANAIFCSYLRFGFNQLDLLSNLDLITVSKNSIPQRGETGLASLLLCMCC